MDIDKLDFLAANAPEIQISQGEVHEMFHSGETYRNPTTEEYQFAHCVKRYEWAQRMIAARNFIKNRDRPRGISVNEFLRDNDALS